MTEIEHNCFCLFMGPVASEAGAFGKTTKARYVPYAIFATEERAKRVR